MRIGYLWRGFLGDIKLNTDLEEVSTPDGNATYSWTIEHECENRKYKLIPLGTNLDAPAATRDGPDIFSAFSQVRRLRSYERMLSRGWTLGSDKEFPELDLVLIEWRWPIPGKNTPSDVGSPSYQTDLERQTAVLRHYSDKGTPIVVWDLDHKFTEDDMIRCADDGLNFRVIETSVEPRYSWITRVDPPCVINELLRDGIDERRPKYYLGYIGSRYERDETIDRWINPIAPPNTSRVAFWGKWEPGADVRTRWPGVQFYGRIGVRGFREAYSRCAAVPILAKESYYKSGFITPRLAEAVMFGSIPIGLVEHRGISQYCASVAKDPNELWELAKHIRGISPLRRRVMREESAHMLSCTDVRNFLDVLEGLVGDAVAG